jgi:NAD(P)-dependent dehydrogenase (short-subunit alcohol dehydrogenase family)
MMLKNKVALVTGGTSGIGRATALAKLNEVIAFGAAGAKVVFSGRREAEGEGTAALIRDAGAECLFVRSDVSIEAEVQAKRSRPTADSIVPLTTLGSSLLANRCTNNPLKILTN